jgi:capsular exopolysaccharide synthesis family protein
MDSLSDATNLTNHIEQEPLSAVADAYRHVLARLLYNDAEHGKIKSIAFVSAMRGDGKSTLTTNVGIALAHTGRSVLLIDASYRRPTLEIDLGLERGVGIVEVLEEQVSLKEAIRSTSTTDLHILGPGLDADRLAGKLASRRVAVLLDYASQKFDYVIVDTPPWLIMADTKLITPLVDGVFLVVGTRASNLGMARRCLRELEEVKAKVIGIVLNGVRPTFGGYMETNRKMYYAYGDDGASRSEGNVPAVSSVPEHDAASKAQL